MTEAAVFTTSTGGFVPTEHARGPWDPDALHGGAPAALLVAAFERHEPVAGTQIARLGFEFLRPIPTAPLSVQVRTIRPGRRVQELAGELRAGGELVCRANALRVAAVPSGLPPLPDGATANERMPGPDQGEPVQFAPNPETAAEASFATSAMEMRWLSTAGSLGPGRVWMRLRPALVDREPASPLARLVATADFANGVSASLPFERFLFINADLHLHLHRPPRGEWIGIDARTLLHEGGTALSDSVLHDVDGPVGRGFQALVVAAR